MPISATSARRSRGGWDGRALQARRGHVTRLLVEELRTRLREGATNLMEGQNDEDSHSGSGGQQAVSPRSQEHQRQVARLRVDGPKEHGERDRRHVSGTKRTDVVAKVCELARRRDAGTAGAAGRGSTVAQWLDHWLDTIAARKVRPSTSARYRQLVGNQLAPGIGHHRLDRLQPEHVTKLYGGPQARGLAPASILQAHRVLPRAFEVAMQRDKVARNVCALVDAPSVEREEVRPLSAQDARLVLEAARGRRSAARWSVALALGLRQCERLA
ncbi:tyrosine recombinase XerC [Geodermatophilus sp. SYSU D01106]